MQVQRIKNQQSFEAIKLPEYRELTSFAQRIIDEMEQKAGLAQQSIKQSVWFFTSSQQEDEYSRELQKVNIPHVKIDDALLISDAVRTLFMKMKVVVGEAIKRDEK